MSTIRKHAGRALKLAVALAPVAAFLLPELSHAQVAAIDVSDAETSITNQTVPMTTIFTAMLGMTVLGVAFRLIKGAMR